MYTCVFFLQRQVWEQVSLVNLGPGFFLANFLLNSVCLYAYFRSVRLNCYNLPFQESGGCDNPSQRRQQQFCASRENAITRRWEKSHRKVVKNSRSHALSMCVPDRCQLDLHSIHSAISHTHARKCAVERSEDCCCSPAAENLRWKLYS